MREFVEYVFMDFTRVNTPRDQVLLEFYDAETADAFKQWWRKERGEDLFAQWCLDQGYDHLLEMDVSAELSRYDPKE